MCGIIGAITSQKNKLTIDREKSEKLIESLAHRGPDGFGEEFNSFFWFGHRRLKVIDLSPIANQPMWDNERRIIITFNGEIYNFLELKRELRSYGHTFRSNSDTEVIIEAYKRWGIKCIDYLNGMFSFGLFDTISNDFFLVRDRLGIKPLYYSMVNNQLVFSSELKGIINYPGFIKRLNVKAVSSFLSYRHCLGDETYFENIFQVQPGSYVNYSEGKLSVEKYWDVLDSKGFNPKSSSNWDLKSLIEDSVLKRKVSDVPLGVFLSGGIDSSIILNAASRNGLDPVNSFSAFFSDDQYSEKKYIDIVSRKCNSPNLKIEIKPEEYLDEIRNYTKIKDQPIGYHNEIATYLLSKKAKEFVSVILAGEGADEVFGGYGRLYRSPFDYHRYHIIKNLPLRLRSSLIYLFKLEKDKIGESELETFLLRYTYFPKLEKMSLFNSQTKEEVNNDFYIQKQFIDAFNQLNEKSFYDKIYHLMLKFHLPGLLQMIDTTSMASGLEVRTPFLDHRIVEKALAIEHTEKVKWKTCWHKLAAYFESIEKISESYDIPKFQLKSKFKNQLPMEIINRKKMGFPVPLNHWFLNEYNHFFKDVVLADNARINRVFDRNKLQNWISVKENQNESMLGRQMWMILGLEIFLQEYF